MRSRHLLVVLIVLISCSFARAGIAHAKARAGDVEYFHDAMELDEMNEREEGTGQTPLMAASLAGMHLAVEKLLDLGADADIPEKDGYNPPHGVAFQGRPLAARALIARGIPVDVAHADGFTPLHRTVWGRSPSHLETAIVLMSEGGADVNRVDAAGYPVAHRAVGERKGRAWIDALLRHGADVAYQVEDTGDTLLHAAVMSQDVEVIEAVVEAGGDVLVKNKKGLTPRGLAKSLGLEAATNVLSRTKFARGKEEL